MMKDKKFLIEIRKQRLAGLKRLIEVDPEDKWIDKEIKQIEAFIEKLVDKR